MMMRPFTRVASKGERVEPPDAKVCRFGLGFDLDRAKTPQVVQPFRQSEDNATK